MSWLYLPELVEDCSQADCSAGEQYALLKSTTTASESCCSGSGTDASTGSPSGTTCEHSTGDRGTLSLPSGAGMYLPPRLQKCLNVIQQKGHVNAVTLAGLVGIKPSTAVLYLNELQHKGVACAIGSGMWEAVDGVLASKEVP